MHAQTPAVVSGNRNDNGWVPQGLVTQLDKAAAALWVANMRAQTPAVASGNGMTMVGRHLSRGCGCSRRKS
jgi:hypothetical protein